MQKHILKRLQEKLNEQYIQWADNYVGKLYQSTKDTPQAKDQVVIAEGNMKMCEETIEILKGLLKKVKKEYGKRA